jgi:hypothetical protein
MWVKLVVRMIKTKNEYETSNNSEIFDQSLEEVLVLPSLMYSAKPFICFV